MIKTLYLTCCFFLLSIVAANAQYSVNPEDQGSMQFNTYNELSTGKTHTNQVKVRIQYYGSSLNVSQWKLTVRLTQDYIADSNSAYSVGAQYTSLKFNSQDGNSPQAVFPTQAFQLSKYNEVTLIQSSLPLNPAVEKLFSFNLIVQGGNHLLTVPNATYKSAYEFKLYKISGSTQQLIGMGTGNTSNSARFQIEYSANNGQSLSLQNGANLFNLQFNTAADFTNGKSVTVNNGLRVNAHQNYQLSVKAAAAEMTSSTTSSTIPVSKLKVEVTTTSLPPASGVTVLGAKALSTTDQTIATRSGTSGGNTIQYNLRFFIDPGALQSNIPAGTYTAYVYFVIVPN